MRLSAVWTSEVLKPHTCSKVFATTLLLHAVCAGVPLLCLVCLYVHRGDALSDRTSGAAAIEDLDTFCRAGECWWAQQV